MKYEKMTAKCNYTSMASSESTPEDVTKKVGWITSSLAQNIVTYCATFHLFLGRKKICLFSSMKNTLTWENIIID